jgi:hypothetical protein
MALEPLLLLRDIREVCLLADPEHPEKVTQRAFDQARSEHMKFLDIPRAERIVKYLKLPWRKVLASAHGEGDQVKLLANQKKSHHRQDWLTEEHVAFCLKLVALRLQAAPGKPVKTVTPAQYHAERERILAEDRSQFAHGAQPRLPTETQITHAVAGKLDRRRKAPAGGKQRKEKARRTKVEALLPQKARTLTGAWDAALELAKLEPTSAKGEPASGVLTSLELLDRFYEVRGAQASSTDLRRFAAANRIPYNRDREKVSWSELIETWKEGLRARGITPPEKPPPWRERPDYRKDVGARRPGERRQIDRKHFDDCLAHVIEYLEQLAQGERSTRRGYDYWASQHEDRPYVSELRKHGVWSEMREKAQEKMREDKSSLPT